MYIIVTDDTMQHMCFLNARQAEMQLNDYLSGVTAADAAVNNADARDDADLEAPDADDGNTAFLGTHYRDVFVVDSTGARVDQSSVVNILHRFSQTLAHEEPMAVDMAPGFRCTLRLSNRLPLHLRKFESNAWPRFAVSLVTDRVADTSGAGKNVVCVRRA